MELLAAGGLTLGPSSGSSAVCHPSLHFLPRVFTSLLASFYPQGSSSTAIRFRTLAETLHRRLVCIGLQHESGPGEFLHRMTLACVGQYFS